MAADTSAADTSATGAGASPPGPAGTPDAALAGLDNLDLVPRQSPRRIGEKIWSAAWPKLLALVLVLRRLRAGPGHRLGGRRPGVQDQAAARGGRLTDHGAADTAVHRLGPVRWAFAWHGLMAGEIVVIILGQPSLGVLLSNDQDQADMAGAISIIIVILVIGIAVDLLFNVVNGRIRRRWGVADNNSSSSNA